MQEGGIDRLSECLSVRIGYYVYRLGLYQTDIFFLFVGTGEKKKRDAGKQGKRYYYFLTFSAHSLLENSQSANIGSITI